MTEGKNGAKGMRRREDGGTNGRGRIKGRWRGEGRGKERGKGKGTAPKADAWAPRGLIRPWMIDNKHV
jgi:hypothetical protein